MHYKPSVDKDTQMSRHKAVELHEDEKLKVDRREEIQLLDEYTWYGKQGLEMLTKFQSTWDGHQR